MLIQLATGVRKTPTDASVRHKFGFKKKCMFHGKIARFKYLNWADRYPMDRRSFLQALAGTATLASMPNAIAQSRRRPNIVFMLVDDLGWGDFGCYGSTFHETPNIDALAREGMRFTQAYAAGPVCSPSRAAIMTGQWPARIGITDWIPGGAGGLANPRMLPPLIHDELPKGTATLGTQFKKLGYRTGYVGKWHLGGDGALPENFGFDVNYGGDNHGHPSWPSHYFGPFAAHNLGGYGKDDYLTEVLSDKADLFLDDAAKRGQPFLLYLAEYAVHIPLQARKAMVEKYRHKNGGKDDPDPVYAAMVEAVDAAVGRLRAKLRAIGVADNTIIILTSDNGGVGFIPAKMHAVAENGPWRAGKGFLYEGGVREPLIVHWPGVVKPGTESASPVTGMDFMPTLLAMAGGGVAPQPCDGIDFTPAFHGRDLPQRKFFWHFPHYNGLGGTPASSMLDGDWKLIEWLEDGHLELFNLKVDPGERYNVASPHQDRALAMQAELHAWRAKMHTGMPRPNPDFGKQSARRSAKQHSEE